jgi:glycosyltransferase involved in cell wall biosynthesis
MVEHDWDVTVYCQEAGKATVYKTEWEGVKLVHISINKSGPISTILFDLKAVIHSLRYDGVFLTLGYNTAVFNILHRLYAKKNVINMDGIEWKREKWGLAAKVWFRLNEIIGCWVGNHLVADHPKIADHLATKVTRKKITMIPYGGLEIGDADESVLTKYKIDKNKYAIVIARAEPENSILEVVTAFSKKRRGINLVVLGTYTPDKNTYHKQVMDAASDEVLFPGAIYEKNAITALRYFARIYVHGHKVGGTNPSLVEAIGAGNAILAHDNEFNRWVAKDGAIYFNDQASADEAFDRLIGDEELVKELRLKSKENYYNNFQWNDILHQYEILLERWLPE